MIICSVIVDFALGLNTYTVRSSIYAVPIYKKLGFKESESVTSKEGIRFQPMVLER
ncbi:GNAT family N-acetyltransferase [Brenneria uluponensis]|uniref:GNAT family N-acetyltransferase n=1 Tax=Brenneria uluponensis TaxID=3057057 RepID=UPI003CCC63BE